MASRQQGDLRLSGPTPDQGADGWTRSRAQNALCKSPGELFTHCVIDVKTRTSVPKEMGEENTFDLFQKTGMNILSGPFSMATEARKSPCHQRFSIGRGRWMKKHQARAVPIHQAWFPLNVQTS
ncbi:hypothetical protein PoB_002867300 [Plakobranchus ocellatus]|uniref:Uncharacterized protein n=1 Tax=Plakobranchus ocellatus TaxID=259542 RepID=A0AAV4A4N9_9GAST|nr:hypothetical protein PoB_002867300 [Plakobranchus ocellatus]